MARAALETLARFHEIQRPNVEPSALALARVIEEVFWCSIDHYEGVILRPRVYFPPTEALSNAQVMRFSEPSTLTRRSLRKLSPAHVSDSGLLAVCSPTTDESELVGLLFSQRLARDRSPRWLSVEATGPGSLRIRNGHDVILEFNHGNLRVYGGAAADRHYAAFRLSKKLGLPDATQSVRVATMVLDIGRMIEARGHGGAIWIAPSGRQEGDLLGLGYAMTVNPAWNDAYQHLWRMQLTQDPSVGTPFFADVQENRFLAQDALTRSIAALAGVDGAILLSGEGVPLAFGVVCNKFTKPVERLVRRNDDGTANAVDPSDFGGSRHRSAIDYCSSHHPAAAVVASHDGGLTVFTSSAPGAVIGGRISAFNAEPVPASALELDP